MKRGDNAKPFKRRWTEPVPAGATITTDRRGRQVARWTDADGRTRSAPVVTSARGTHAGALRIACVADNYSGEYRDGDGKIRRVVLGPDFDAAAKQLKALVAEAHRERTGLASSAERRQRGPIDEALEEFGRVLATTGRHRHARKRKVRRPVSPAYLAETLRQIRGVVSACGFQALEDIAPGPIARYVDGLTDKRRKDADGKPAPIGPTTRNAYLDAVHGFVRWCVAEGRMVADPLADVAVYDESEDVRRNRRALSHDEAAALITTAARRPIERAQFFVKLNGRDATDADRRRVALGRALLWKFLMLTGLRKSEAAGVTWADVDLEAGHVFVSGQLSKNGYDDHVALRADLCRDLEQWRGIATPKTDAAPLFDVPANLVRVLKRDLKAAGIDARTTAGETIDVHACRTTCATWIAAVSSESVAGRHLRHGKPASVTGRHYIKPALAETRAALDRLPALPIPGLHAQADAEKVAQLANGTTGQSEPRLKDSETMYKPTYKDSGRVRLTMADNGEPPSDGPNRTGKSNKAKSPGKRNVSGAFRIVASDRPHGDSNPGLQDENRDTQARGALSDNDLQRSAPPCTSRRTGGDLGELMDRIAAQQAALAELLAQVAKLRGSPDGQENEKR